MLTFTPGDDLPVIENGRDWVFVLDVSGSMQGKFATLANGVQQALGKLNPNDRFRIFTFNDGSRELTGGFNRRAAPIFMPDFEPVSTHWTAIVRRVLPW